MDKTPNYYAIIPAEVRYDNNLTDREKLLFAEITCLTNKTGECWASNEHFAKLYGVSDRSIRTSILNLIKCGYLDRKIIYKENSKEIKSRILTLRKNISIPYGKNLPYPMEENFRDNNTSINNTSINISSTNQSCVLECGLESFNLWWLKYPKKVSKGSALKSFNTALKKTDISSLLVGLDKYISHIKKEKIEKQYIKHPTTWLNQECWLDEYDEITSDDFGEAVEERIKNGD